MWAQKSHIQPRIQSQKEANALLVWNKGDSSQSSTHWRQNWGRSLDSGGNPYDWGLDLKMLIGSYICDVLEQNSKKSRSRASVSVCLYVQISDLHTLMVWSNIDSVVSEETVQLSSVSSSHLLLLYTQDVSAIYIMSARWQRSI